jgi:hypothetical protein
VASQQSLESNTARKPHFLTAVLKGQKEFLLGDEHELSKWVEYGWLRREPTSPAEIKDLLGIVDRSLADSKVEGVSTDLRFIAAFNAALCVATTGLRASGVRTVTQAGPHVKTIESLELTIRPTRTSFKDSRPSTQEEQIGLRRCGRRTRSGVGERWRNSQRNRRTTPWPGSETSIRS